MGCKKRNVTTAFMSDSGNTRRAGEYAEQPVGQKAFKFDGKTHKTSSKVSEQPMGCKAWCNYRIHV